MPEFSIVIPCYKSADKIAKCLGSLKDQDFKDIEIICVMDGPDPDAEEIVKAFGVKCVVKEHSGVQATRNKGLELSTGKYVMFSDPDMYWDPGVLRLHKECFDRHKVDFCYSGYRWVGENDGHIPLEFDAYALGIHNYIDGANPVKRELLLKVGGWDESVKRFQDWDMWLRIVSAGGVGKKLAIDTSRSTDKPNEDSISGGKYDYTDWYNIVRKKNGIKEREICVTSIAAPQHALRVAKACGWDYWAFPSMLPNKYKAIYVLGMFTESIDHHVRLFVDWKGCLRDCKYLVHWIGTDVLNMQIGHSFAEAKAIRKMFEKHNIIHFSQSDANRIEMEELGFKIKTLPLPLENEFELYPMPERFTVSVYDHGGIDNKWHKWLVMELTKAMPDVEWLFYGDKDTTGRTRNQTWLGRVPIKEVIKKSSCHLRLTIHDGYPVAPVEFMLSGRRSIINTPDMKFADYVDLGAVNEDRVVEMKQLIYNKIREVQKNPKIKNHEEVKKWYENLLSPVNFKKEVEGVVNAKD